ncbi:tRNA (adenosine(37)-N6)-dimethylallyltransferase MiaA [Bartonella sp. HY761]|uniref:tRNA (adenosine(37)-N6)-dimethylallyltransferase MiaA n=1 Tax=Bartonella sp. HY761 TaxID=2979330 RepID=UPI0022023A1E|nr:tRNA (adenosine(37)-N6)-dimethylallyltransferase MiaA [Bartonella sp. HY761]UXN05501.1 tRNA (adenosine(37)-N6)-dimethylallyltransferase MiaA [Bartonella sp. HY761]
MDQNSANTQKNNVILIAGPTASGKSQLAIDLALAYDGVIINTDSMQIYDVLNLLTARPSPRELAQAPHHLYGHVSPKLFFSTGHWLENVQQLLYDNQIANKTLIFVGGTGLYFRALIGGVAQMPEIPNHIREKWRNALIEKGAPTLHEVLSTEDPITAERLNPNDGQRIARALEIIEATQKSITWWQAQKTQPLINAENAIKIVLAPERQSNKSRISLRLDQMVKFGALDEVETLLALDLAPSMPAMKAIGVREFSNFLSGKAPLNEALERAKIETYQYAKRQMTWFRNQFKEDWQHFESSDKAFISLKNLMGS